MYADASSPPYHLHLPDTSSPYAFQMPALHHTTYISQTPALPTPPRRQLSPILPDISLCSAALMLSKTTHTLNPVSTSQLTSGLAKGTKKKAATNQVPYVKVNRYCNCNYEVVVR